ncbi:MAG: CDP-alcohol phosphatidyltransferase [Thermoprotei archaeon ex4572_64]|nr:MAG: CDP-alcohol phosphatidyltransferase [Thermoprotei archaeon ex4572_64]
MLSRIKARFERNLTSLIKVLPKDPNLLTISSLITTLPTPVLLILFGLNILPLVILLVVIAGFLDILDGICARSLSRTTRLGSFLDSTIDRYVDFIILLNFIIITNFNINILVLVLFSLMGSLMTSYVRAKAESLQLSLSGVGIFERSERIIYLIITLIIFTITYNHFLIFIMLLIFAIITNVTAIERILKVIKRLKRE